jgi:hypothetical protein
MLPFLKKKEAPVAGIVIKTRTPDEKPAEEMSEVDDQMMAVESCAQELIRAVHARDAKAVAMALIDAFDILESLPHDEAKEDQVEPHSYDAQNIIAGREED